MGRLGIQLWSNTTSNCLFELVKAKRHLHSSDDHRRSLSTIEKSDTLGDRSLYVIRPCEKAFAP